MAVGVFVFVCDIHLFAPFPPPLWDGWEFCRPATQVTPSASPARDAAVSEHLQVN